MDAVIFAALGGLVVCVVMFLRHRLASFRSQRSEDYANEPPRFDIQTHLNGAMLCEGTIFGPLGRVVSRFVADFDIIWDGHEGTMTEHFRYSDGSVQDRAWQLIVGSDGFLTARADDVIGDGNGRQVGSAMWLNYRLRLPPSSGGHVLNVVDWMYLLPNGTLVNRSQFRTFGITVAELVATIRPVTDLTKVAE